MKSANNYAYHRLRRHDPEIYDLIKEEEQRQASRINLIASENYASQASLEAQASITADKLAEGSVGKRFCSGCEVIDKIEKLAVNRAKALFKAEHVNVQSPSATQANLAVYTALLKPGDTVLASLISHGAHFSHGSRRHISGQLYKFSHYGVSPETGLIDFEEVEKKAFRTKPKLIIAGASSYPRKIEFSEFKRIADKVGALFMADIAHVIGLIIARLHPDPAPYADVITSSTHKTLRGPRGGGIILCKKRFADAIDKSVFPGLQGAPMMNIIASRAVIFKEAMSEKFAQYQKSVLDNAKALEETLASNGVKMVTGGTDTHMIIIDLHPQGLSGKEAEELLSSVGIDSNKNLIPYDDKAPNITSGLRLGVTAITTRGMKTDDVKEIGMLLSKALLNPKSQSILGDVRKKAGLIAGKFPLFSKEWI